MNSMTDVQLMPNPMAGKTAGFKQILVRPNLPATSACETTNISTLFNQTPTAAAQSPVASSTAPIMNAPKFMLAYLQFLTRAKIDSRVGK